MYTSKMISGVLKTFIKKQAHMERETKSQSDFADACTSPLLVFVHGKSKKKSQTFYSLSKKRLYVRSIHELRNVYNCWPIPQGGLMMLSDPDSNKFALFNPATMAKVIELPQLKSKLSGYCDFILSSPRTDQHGVVMCKDFRHNHLLFCQLGGDKWFEYEYDVGEDDLQYVVACKGKFYGLTGRKRFLSIEFDPQPSLSILAKEHRPELPVGQNCYRTFLLESCEEIFCVMAYVALTAMMKIVQFSVYKFDFTKKEWDSVGSIGGDRVFFLSADGFSASWSASELGVKGDCIYFVRKEDKCMYAYDVEEGTISTHLPCPKVPSPWCTPFWIMPAF